MYGVTNYYNTPYLIDLINQGSLIVPDFEIPVPETFLYPEQRQHLYVPGSAEAYVGIIGTADGIFHSFLFFDHTYSIVK